MGNMQQSTVFIKYNLPTRLCYRMVVLGGGRQLKTSTYHRFFVAQAHNISMATGRCVWLFMVASQQKKKSRWCHWYSCGRGRGHGWWNVRLMSGGYGREDGGRRRTYHIHPSISSATLCGKMVTEKNRMYLGSRGGRGRVRGRWNVCFVEGGHGNARSFFARACDGSDRD